MVDCMFKEILLENGEANAGEDYKKKLKELILEAILEAVLVKKKKRIYQSKLCHKELNQTQ